MAETEANISFQNRITQGVERYCELKSNDEMFLAHSASKDEIKVLNREVTETVIWF